MLSPGYVYILLNPAMEGLLKIGKTTRDPATRVAELSSATGVPTPFILAFRVETTDCDALERAVHQRLAALGYRYADQREFFTAPLHEAIEAVLSLRTELPTPRAALGEEEQTPEPLWRSAELAAEAAYNGLGDELQDLVEARRRYERAKALGSISAHVRLGQMFARGEGGPRDTDRAKDLFAEAAGRGDARGHAELALLFEEQRHAENASKCWLRYFREAQSVDTRTDEIYRTLYMQRSAAAPHFQLLETLRSECGLARDAANAVRAAGEFDLPDEVWSMLEAVEKQLSRPEITTIPLTASSEIDVQAVRYLIEKVNARIKALDYVRSENLRRSERGEGPFRSVTEMLNLKGSRSR